MWCYSIVYFKRTIYHKSNKNFASQVDCLAKKTLKLTVFDFTEPASHFSYNFKLFLLREKRSELTGMALNN